jgi:hypothetical protein
MASNRPTSDQLRTLEAVRSRPDGSLEGRLGGINLRLDVDGTSACPESMRIRSAALARLLDQWRHD